MNKNTLYSAIVVSSLLLTSGYAFSQSQEDMNSFQCTDEEVEQYLIESAERREVNKQTIPSFEDHKPAYQEKSEQEAVNEGREVECNTFLDDFSAPSIPDDFFDFDPSRISDIGSMLVQALSDALSDGFCRVISADYVESNINDNIYDYRGAFREEGVRRINEPWGPQVIQKQLRETYGRRLGDAMNFSDDDHVDNFRRYFGNEFENELDSITDEVRDDLGWWD